MRKRLRFSNEESLLRSGRGEDSEEGEEGGKAKQFCPVTQQAFCPSWEGTGTGSFAAWTKILTFHVIVFSAFALKATFSNGKHF